MKNKRSEEVFGDSIVKFMNLDADRGPSGSPGADPAAGALRADREARFFTALPQGRDRPGQVVTDGMTGLTWARNAGISEFPPSWREAHDFIAGLNASAFSGIDTWRLPRRGELFSLISHRRINPALPGGHPFGGVFNGYYWTATACARLPEQAWYVHLGGGRVQHGMKHGKDSKWTGKASSGNFPD